MADIARPFTLREDLIAAWSAYTLGPAGSLDRQDPRYTNGLLDVFVKEVERREGQAVENLKRIRDDSTTPMNTAADIDQVLVECLGAMED